MKLGNWINKLRKKQYHLEPDKSTHWVKCNECNAIMYHKEVKRYLFVCPKCGFHMRIDARSRVELLADENSFVERDIEIEPLDPLNFVDKKPYRKKIQEEKNRHGVSSAVLSGECLIDKLPAQLVVFNFNFMGGSLGSVEGEKIVRACNRALQKRQPLIIVSASGGARMQENIFSLMQMSKTSAAIAKLNDNNILYISILTHPTTGGVSASFAFLGDIIISEPRALIGFAGPRVIKHTIKKELPDNFQKSESLLMNGFLDMVVQRGGLKKTVSDLIKFFHKDYKQFENVKDKILKSKIFSWGANNL